MRYLNGAFILITIVVFIEWLLSPRFDYYTTDDEKWIILWYGRKKRKYIKLFKT